MRLGIEERGIKKLFLTPFNTIKGTNFTEIFVDDFFNILNNNLDKDFGAYYIEESNNFKIILDGEEYYLTLDEVTMNNYLFGKDNEFTRSLRRVINKTEQRDKGELSIRKDKKMIGEIIKKAEQGIILDDEARKIYLEYLKNSQKFSFQKAKTYFYNLIRDFIDSLDNAGNELDIWPFTEMWYDLGEYFWNSNVISLLIAVIVDVVIYCLESKTGISISSNYYWLALIPQTTYLVAGTKIIINQIKSRYVRFLNFNNKRKIIDHKIEQLTSELKYGPKEFSDKFDKGLLEDGHKEKKPTNEIFKELFELIRKIEYLNENERKIYCDKVWAIAADYVDRAKKINSTGLSDGIVLELEGELVLKQDIMSKINLLNEEIYKKTDVRIKNQRIDDEYEMLARQIENCYNREDKVIGGERPPKARRP